MRYNPCRAATRGGRVEPLLAKESPEHEQNADYDGTGYEEVIEVGALMFS